MRNPGTKMNIIIASALAIAAIFVMINPLMFGFCRGVSTWGNGTKYCYSSITDEISEEFVLSIGSISILLLLFTFFTYRMKEEVFRVWWNFARWMVLIIIFATIAIQFVPSGGGFFNMDALIYLLVLAPLYAIFILVSLWKIVRMHRKSKNTP